MSSPSPSSIQSADELPEIEIKAKFEPSDLRLINQPSDELSILHKVKKQKAEKLVVGFNIKVKDFFQSPAGREYLVESARKN